ncbi:MAG: GntR family transcriptional regulator [Lentisphaeria bacterium]|nr:GntR family transcriptional regulator [Lentisphaeria bacterium]
MDRRGRIQLQIRRYIRSILLKQASLGEEIPLREIALAEYFQTTRTTVQAVCRDLVADGTLIRIPGRRGLFVNTDSPACRGPGLDFRILCGSGREQIFDFAAQNIVTGFTRSFRDFYGGYCYNPLLSSDPAEAERELMEIPCYAFLWIRPEPQFFPVAEKLIDAGFPVVMIASYYDFNVPFPATNAILFDYAVIGRDRAEWILRNGFRRPLVYSGCSEMIGALSGRLEASGKKLPSDSVVWLPTPREIRGRLPEKIRRYKPDCLIADGRIFPTFSAFAADVPELKDIPIYLENAPFAAVLQKRHPELKIQLSSWNYCDPMVRIGECAGEMMRSLLDKPGRFANRKYTEFPEKKTKADRTKGVRSCTK